MNIVYSTNPNYNPNDEEPEVETLAPERQKLRVSIERHHRGGKVVTLVRGFVGNDESLQTLARLLKTKCGTGGSAKDGEIVIQGEVRDKVLALLLGLGYKNSK